MAKHIDLTGGVFGRLTVISKSGKRGLRRLWSCRCVCGNVIEVTTQHLQNGAASSCGCLRKELAIVKSKARTLPVELLRKHQYHWRYKHSAKGRGLDFNLSKDEAWDIAQQDCFYCGAPPCNALKDGTKVIGIDRMDNTLGYVHGNCVPCCIQCNTAKSDYTMEEFLTWIKNLYEGCYGKA